MMGVPIRLPIRLPIRPDPAFPICFESLSLDRKVVVSIFRFPIPR